MTRDDLVSVRSTVHDARAAIDWPTSDGRVPEPGGPQIVVDDRSGSPVEGFRRSGA